jgi:hypothetical protein
MDPFLALTPIPDFVWDARSEAEILERAQAFQALEPPSLDAGGSATRPSPLPAFDPPRRVVSMVGVPLPVSSLAKPDAEAAAGGAGEAPARFVSSAGPSTPAEPIASSESARAPLARDTSYSQTRKPGADAADSARAIEATAVEAKGGRPATDGAIPVARVLAPPVAKTVTLLPGERVAERGHPAPVGRGFHFWTGMVVGTGIGVVLGAVLMSMFG